jgi:hypothetical protein
MGPSKKFVRQVFGRTTKRGQDNGEACACVCTTCTYGRITSTYKWKVLGQTGHSGQDNLIIIRCGLAALIEKDCAKFWLLFFCIFDPFQLGTVHVDLSRFILDVFGEVQTLQRVAVIDFVSLASKLLCWGFIRTDFGSSEGSGPMHLISLR